jgi:hypothetical protein
LTGAWYGTRRQDRGAAIEFFEMTHAPYGPNIYWVEGAGTSYAYSGFGMLSSQKKLAFGLTITDPSGQTYESTGAVIGAFNSRKNTATTTGLDSPPGTGAPTNRVTFQVTKRTSLP